MGAQLPDGQASAKRGSFNQTPIAFAIPEGIAPVYALLAPSAGSTDLIEPRQAHGVESHQRAVVIDGAVSGMNNGFTGLIQKGEKPRVAIKGVVVGGNDYLYETELAFRASQQQQLTDNASALALLSVIQ